MLLGCIHGQTCSLASHAKDSMGLMWDMWKRVN